MRGKTIITKKQLVSITVKKTTKNSFGALQTIRQKSVPVSDRESQQNKGITKLSLGREGERLSLEAQWKALVFVVERRGYDCRVDCPAESPSSPPCVEYSPTWNANISLYTVVAAHQTTITVRHLSMHHTYTYKFG